MPRKTGHGTLAWPECTTVAFKTSNVPPTTIARVFSRALKSMKSPLDGDSSGNRVNNRRKARFKSTRLAFVSRWAITKELELGTIKVGQVSGVKTTRHFALITRTGPEPHGAAGALRDFALARARLLSNTPRKSLQTRDSSR